MKQRDRLSDVTDGITFLKNMKTTWEDYKVAMGMIRDILMYLVRARDDLQFFCLTVGPYSSDEVPHWPLNWLIRCQCWIFGTEHYVGILRRKAVVSL